jgi:radical SAM protein with 4Fe4S-binding SPASM domain
MSKRFKKVFIEITSCCNLQCKFCPPTKRKAEFIALARFRQILRQIQPFTHHIYLHVKGEPLLHSHLSDLLDIADNEHLRVHIITNGTLIQKQAEMLLSKPALHKINFSLHSFEQNEFAESNETYIQNVLDFAQKAGETGRIIVSLRLWNLNGVNADNELNKQNDEILFHIKNKFLLDQNIEISSIPGKGLKLAENVYLNFDSEFVWPHLSDSFLSTTGFCQALRNQAAILVDGTVVPCCLDGEGIIELGNVYKQSFAEIIDNERAKSIFNGFSQNKVVEQLCQKCRYKERFSV